MTIDSLNSELSESRDTGINGDILEKDASSPLSTGKNMFWNSAGSIVNLGMQWLITVLVVRLSGNYEAAGILSLAMSIYNIFAPLAIYRMYTYQVSDVNREHSVGEYFAFRIITCCGAFFFTAIYAFFTCPDDAWLSILLYFCYRMCGLLIDVLHGEDQLNGRMDYVGKSLMLQGVSSFAAFCVTLLFSQNLEASIVSMSVATIVVGVLFDLPKTRRFGEIKIHITKAAVIRLISYCLPITLAAIACSATPSIPRQFLALSQGSELLGIYASVAAPTAIIQMGASYIYNPLLSQFALYHAKGDHRNIKRLFLKALGGIVGVGALCALLFALLGPSILALLFGESILPYTYLLLPVVGLSVLTAYIWFINDLLVSMREFAGSFIGNLVAFAVSVAISFPMIEAFSMNGISFAGIGSFAIAGIVMTAFFWPYLTPKPTQTGHSR